jgi:NAD(P)-dependent dehydrogenase (short-subunit alcohol dehydrogenase family)
VRLRGRCALVTGTAGGIGAAVARRFRDEGANVIGIDLRAPDASLGLAEIDQRMCDVTDRVAVTALLRALPPPDILVHTAALLGGSGPFLETDDAAWLRYIHVNLTGTFVVCQEVARAMVASGLAGRIVTFGSVNSFAAEPDAVPYVASKGGVRMLTKAMAVALAPHGIAVNMVAPGPITVPRNAAMFGDDSFVRHLGRVVPMARTGTPDEVAHAALFLADPATGYVTGSELVVDGGMLAVLHGPDPD